MARGQQKIQSQQKAAEKSAKLKKAAGHTAADQKKVGVHLITFFYNNNRFAPRSYVCLYYFRVLFGELEKKCV